MSHASIDGAYNPRRGNLTLLMAAGLGNGDQAISITEVKRPGDLP